MIRPMSLWRLRDFLATLQFLPLLLFGLPAGVWVDRMARRRVVPSRPGDS